MPGGALLFADALINVTGEVSFVPDSLMDDPEADKRAMLDSLEALLERETDTLLFAHGDPIVGGGNEVLQRLRGQPALLRAARRVRVRAR